MYRTLFAAAGFLFLTAAAVAETPPPSSANEPPGAKLPPGEGRELVMRTCSKCHDPSIAAGEDLDGPGWKLLVDQMAANGANATDDEFAEIVAYLTRAFPAK